MDQYEEPRRRMEEPMKHPSYGHGYDNHGPHSGGGYGHGPQDDDAHRRYRNHYGRKRR